MPAPVPPVAGAAYATAGSRELRHRPHRERSVAATAEAFFVAAERRGKTVVDDVVSGKSLVTLAETSHDTALSADANVLAVIGYREAHIYELPRGRERAVLTLREPPKAAAVKARGVDELQMGGLLAALGGYGTTTIAAERFALSADGSVLAITMSGQEDLFVFDTKTGARTHRIAGAAGEGEVAISGDGRRVVTFPKPLPAPSSPAAVVGEPAPERKATIWELASDTALGHVPLPSSGKVAVALSPDGARVALLADGALSIRAAEKDEVQHTRDAPQREEPQPFGFGSHGSAAVVFSPDGSLLAFHHREGITVLDAGTFAERGTFETKPLEELVFSGDSRRIGAIAATGDVSWIDLAAREASPVPPGHVGSVESLSFSRDGALLASTAEDGALLLWDAETGRLFRKLSRGGGYGVATFTADTLMTKLPDGRLLAVDFGDGVDTPAVRTLGQSAYGERELAIARDGAVVAFARGTTWDHEEPPRVVLVRRGGEPIAEPELRGGALGLAFHPDGSHLAALHGSHGEAVGAGVVFFESATGAELDRLALPAMNPTHLLGFGAAGDALVVEDSSRATVIDLHTKRPVRVFDTDDRSGCSPVRALSRDGRVLASATCDSPIRLFDTTSGAHLGSLVVDGPAQLVALAFDPVGDRLAAGADDGTIRLYRVASALPPVPPSPRAAARSDGADTYGRCTLDATGKLACPTLGLADVKAVAHSAALTADGRVHAFRLTASGADVQPLAGIDDATAVAGNYAELCALRQGGQVACSRYDYKTQRWSAPAERLTSVRSLSERCALRDDGKVTCWASGATTSEPTEVAGIEDAVALAVGGAFGCALRGDGTVRCWGRNERGELGDGTGVASDEAVTVAGLTEVVELAISGSAACARTKARQVRCWGAIAGAMVDAEVAPLVPVELPAARGATALVGTPTAMCLRDAAGELACFKPDKS